MVLFLLFALPCLYLTLYILLSGRYLSQRYTFKPLIQGALTYIPIYFILLAIERIVTLRYSPVNIYFYYLINDIAVPFILIMTAYFLFHPKFITKTRREWLIEMLAFLSGFYLIEGILTFFGNLTFFNPYILFLLPQLWMGMMLFITSLILVFSDSWINIKILIGAAGLAVLFFAGLVPYFFHMKYFWLSYLIAGAFFAGACTVFFFTNMSFFIEQKRQLEL
jgi:hypothetical protein